MSSVDSAGSTMPGVAQSDGASSARRRVTLAGSVREALRRRSAVGPVMFLAASAVLVALLGFPGSRDLIAVWVIAALLAFSLTDVFARAKDAIREFAPLMGLVIAYDALRGGAKDLFATHYLPQIRIDEALFGGSDPTVSLQHALWRGVPRWYDVVLSGVYATHFFAFPLLAVTLWSRDHMRFRRFLATIVTLSAVGLLTYALYPAAPPWLASRNGFLPHVTRIVPVVWRDLDLRFLDSLVQSGYHYANNVAAVPSLHTAFAVVIAAFLWPRERRWLRPLVAAYPIAMAFVLVYTGEHYVFDVLLGGLYAAGSLLLVRAIAGRCSRRAAALARA